jgi:hypothetical protein
LENCLGGKHNALEGKVMSAGIMYRGSGIWMSNGLKDCFFDAVLSMVQRVDPECADNMKSGHLQGLYEVSGLGFDIQDFVEYFGSEERFLEVTRSQIDSIRELCRTESCKEQLTKVFEWIWFLMDGGSFSNDERVPNLDSLPDHPPQKIGMPNPQCMHIC